ncbi:DUF3320 domain-containing protein [Salinarimonas sp.]|uniref:DUF3320 domain-containing protein n=1 Tax=Salinarimonas sp. TaxID=2766526 RepID=UPI0032D8BA0D
MTPDASPNRSAGRLQSVLEARLAEARARLIETGTRNRLVHTNRGAKRPTTLGVLTPDTDALFARLVREGAALRFAPDPVLAARAAAGEVLDEEETEEGGGAFRTPVAHLAAPDADAEMDADTDRVDRLRTRLGPDALEKRLLRFWRDARLTEEEQGVDILYLAIGFLRWYEDERSEVMREAPLVLAPVTLVRDARRSTFDLKAREEDIGLNLPLSERLKEQGITLPAIPEGDEWQPSAYFDAVAAAVSGKPRWGVDRNGVELGLFSFAKLLMFHDLEPDKWPGGALLGHPLLQGLLAEGFDGAEKPVADDAAARLDERYAPSDLVHVVDADHSQTLAVEAARTGTDLVVQGPPGTGKSQTIANILAAAAHDGLSVLFVAEKLVALSVVHDRLERAGLGPLCLELHSRTANKRLVAQELGRTLDGVARAPDLAASDAKLREIRDRLNAIARDLHRPVGDTGTSPYRALGDLARAAGLGLEPPQLDCPALGTWPEDVFAAVVEAAGRLAERTAEHGRADAHPWRGVGDLALQPFDVERLAPDCAASAEALGSLAGRAGQAAAALGWRAPETLAEVAGVALALTTIGEAPPDARVLDALVTLADADRARAARLLAEARDTLAAIEADASLFAPAALEAETSAVRAALARGAGSFFARLGGTYRRAAAELATWAAAEAPRDPAARLKLADRLIALKSRLADLEALGAEARGLLGPLWAGRRTDVAGLLAALDWIAAAGPRLGALREEWPRLRDHAGSEAARDAGRALAVAVREAATRANALRERLRLDLDRAFGAADLGSVGMGDLVSRLEAWSREGGRFRAWVALAEAEETLDRLGARDVARRLADGRLAPDAVAEELRLARAEAVWRAAIAGDPQLGRLDGQERTALVEAFKRLEHARRGAVAALVRARHAEAMPRGAMGEMGVIRGEAAKRRGHMAIRRLMTRAGPSVRRIKPIFLMSPISVAQYLPPGRLAFDLVVIDEASQVRPEDALGVIARAKRIVVVGDAKQLPPTSFFDRLTADGAAEDDGEDAEEGAPLAGAAKATELESILTLCEARGLPRTRLLWHYRSRHPSLIAVSNEEFYDGRLLMPPSPAATRDVDGLVATRVAGAYDRGGRRTNAIEARAVVEAAARHAAERPERSLGIVTFSTAQRDLVSALLDETRRTDPVLDGFIAARESGEELFVKNLENVQGDERDAILISVGYGPREAGGRLDSMNFGPVSAEGGERRLNVLFTRARFRCEVFLSFDPAEIDPKRASGAGPRAFKRFLTYAESGVLEEARPTGRDFESGFEEDVARALAALGYTADPQVGQAGFRIDLGVRDPEAPGRYLLAVECDGATYHGALWARERDRLRQEVLEGMGWRFHRIWSTDWYYRREAEIARLRAALEEAPARSGDAPPAAAPPPPRIDFVPEPPRDLFEAPPTPAGDPYVLASVRPPKGIEPHEAKLAQAHRMVVEIVEAEGPIHRDEIARRYAAAFGAKRTGARILETVDKALAWARHSEAALAEEDGFWFTAVQHADPPVRDRAEAPTTVRDAAMIAPLEIRAAGRRALAENGALAEDEMITAIARLLGFQRTGADLRARIGAAIAEAPPAPMR